MTPRPPAPPYVQYAHPPAVIDGAAVDMPTLDGWQVRFKAFEYGVISLALTQPMPAAWEDVLTAGVRWHEDADLAGAAERICRKLVGRLEPALSRLRTEFLSEDYLVFTITRLSDVDTADGLIATHGERLAQVLRGEREPLSAKERDDVLRQRISYLTTDLVVPTWSTALIYDTEAAAQGVLEIVEFANSQLLEFRYYDHLLDAELQRIYSQLQQSGWAQSWFGRRFSKAARHLHALFIDVNELTDKTENALKIAGDAYAARLFTLVAARLGLDQWKANVREKLATLDAIYRFAVEQTAMARGELLELMIVLILVFELVLFFAGIMQ
jgi:hypothetical protein